jgi:hypothetical protein
MTKSSILDAEQGGKPICERDVFFNTLSSRIGFPTKFSAKIESLALKGG